jgi:hypothetical protein
MNTLQLIIVCVTALGLAAIYRLPAMVKSGGDALSGRTLVVHTRQPDDQTIRGVVHAFDDSLVVLRDAVYLTKDGQHQPAGGTVTIPRANISNWQELPAMAA